MKLLKNIFRIIGYILTSITSILMFIYYLLAMFRWLGIIGVIAGVLVTPLAVIFPLIFWVVEGIFPVFYFLLWGLWFVGLIFMAIGKDNDK